MKAWVPRQFVPTSCEWVDTFLFSPKSFVLPAHDDYDAPFFAEADACGDEVAVVVSLLY